MEGKGTMKNKIHEICFRNAENDWDSALPVGNGRLGAMVFYKNHALHIALNHYDCYYQGLPKMKMGETYEALCRRTDEARKSGDTSFCHYAKTLRPVTEITRPDYRGTSYPVGGEYLLFTGEKVNTDYTCLKLRIEEGEIWFEAGEGEIRATAKIIAAREPDGMLLELSQTEEGLWQSGEWTAFGKNTVRSGETFAAWDKRRGEPGAFLALSLQPGAGAAEEAVREILEKREQVKKTHKEYWKGFWHSTVILPDKFLERLWHMQLYLLDCSGAKGSGYPEQCWGLSGLWDIRRPNMWGSTWYWDVNIQSAFWGTYSAGHPELLKLFCDGYLAYEEEIHGYTRQVYGREGWALDYPHTLYHCIQPWCAQFLWLYYQYSGDEEFLRKKAYPVFAEQIAFFTELAKQDEEGIWHIEYDISPEQGPVTKDSVITVACIKKLLRTAIEAAGILGRPKKEAEKYARILARMPRYPLTSGKNRYKDSVLAQDDLFLRHPSLLMPLFPAEEIGPDGETEIWENTLRYMKDHTETGTFGMGWLSAAAAKLGWGNEAVEILYEKGLDYVLHENGLAYEESPRFLNYCHLTKPAHYLPVMMEAAGGIINAVNLMLVQTSAEGVLKVFPAVPEKERELPEKILAQKVQYREERKKPGACYESWKDMGFVGLMAPGGFVVSARRRDDRILFIRIESTREAVLKLFLPGELSKDGGADVVTRRMRAGETICFGDSAGFWEAGEETEVLCHRASETGRRIFLGADRHTGYFKLIDAFTCPYLFGNELQYHMTPYVFDFGLCKGFKDYSNAYPVQTIRSGRCVLYCGGPRRLGAEQYPADCFAEGNTIDAAFLTRSYGFLNAKDIRAIERSGPDDLRKDFLESQREAVFVINLPKGKYDLLIVSGDEKEASFAEFCLAAQGTRTDTGLLGAGRYACKILPAVQEADGELRLRIRTKEGYSWKLNAIFVNRQYSL